MSLALSYGALIDADHQIKMKQVLSSAQRIDLLAQTLCVCPSLPAPPPREILLSVFKPRNPEGFLSFVTQQQVNLKCRVLPHRRADVSHLLSRAVYTAISSPQDSNPDIDVLQQYLSTVITTVTDLVHPRKANVKLVGLVEQAEKQIDVLRDAIRSAQSKHSTAEAKCDAEIADLERLLQKAKEKKEIVALRGAAVTAELQKQMVEIRNVRDHVMSEIDVLQKAAGFVMNHLVGEDVTRMIHQASDHVRATLEAVETLHKSHKEMELQLTEGPQRRVYKEGWQRIVAHVDKNKGVQKQVDDMIAGCLKFLPNGGPVEDALQLLRTRRRDLANMVNEMKMLHEVYKASDPEKAIVRLHQALPRESTIDSMTTSFSEGAGTPLGSSLSRSATSPEGLADGGGEGI